MNFKKYIISMIVCSVTIFTMFFNMFTPLRINATSNVPDDVVYNALVSRVSGFGLQFSVGFICGLDTTGTLSKYYSDFLSLCSQYPADNYIYVTGTTDTSYSLQIWNFKEFLSNGGVSECNYVRLGYDINYNIPSGSSVPAYYSAIGVTNQIAYSKQYCTASYTYNGFSYGDIPIDDSDKEDTSFFGRLWHGLKDMWYSDDIATNNFLFGDDSIIDYWDNIGNNWCDFIKTTLGITDNDTLNTVMNDIYNNDYSRDYWTNIDISKINQIQNTSNNLKNFWSNNVTVVNDDDNSYHYEIKNYNPVTNTYPSYLYDMNYFNNYILASDNTDLSDITNWLRMIYNLETSINTNIESTISMLNNSIINTILEIGADVNALGGIFADFDFNVIAGGFADIDANFNALGGVIAGAIGVAWADIKADLQLMIDSINLNFGDITIGDSSTSDDDTTNKIKFDFDSLVDKINLKFKDLFDDLKINIKDLFDDIHVTIDKDDTSSSGDIEIVEVESDFWLQVKNIMLRKIPLYAQCLDLLEPTTDISADYITNSNPGLLGNGSIDSNNQLNLITSYYIDDGQIGFDTPVETPIFSGLVSITSNSDNNLMLINIPMDVEFYGYIFGNISLDITYYYVNYRQIVSDVLLTFYYIMFAWGIIHKVVNIFGKDKEVK